MKCDKCNNKVILRKKVGTIWELNEFDIPDERNIKNFAKLLIQRLESGKFLEYVPDDVANFEGAQTHWTYVQWYIYNVAQKNRMKKWSQTLLYVLYDLSKTDIRTADGELFSVVFEKMLQQPCTFDDTYTGLRHYLRYLRNPVDLVVTKLYENMVSTNIFEQELLEQNAVYTKEYKRLEKSLFVLCETCESIIDYQNQIQNIFLEDLSFEELFEKIKILENIKFLRNKSFKIFESCSIPCDTKTHEHVLRLYEEALNKIEIYLNDHGLSCK